MDCWLPARFDDLVYRIDTLYYAEKCFTELLENAKN